jgi:hypothetical protein
MFSGCINTSLFTSERRPKEQQLHAEASKTKKSGLLAERLLFYGNKRGKELFS